MHTTLVGFLCVAGGTVAFAVLAGMPWVVAAQRTAWFSWVWVAAAWLSGLAGALALLGYGAALLTVGTAAFTTVLFFYIFLVCFTVSLGAARRLLLMRYQWYHTSLRVQYLVLLLLIVYVALVYLWMAGTLLAALTPLVVLMAGTIAATYARRQSYIVVTNSPGQPTPRRDTLYWLSLLFVAMGAVGDWALCQVGARDILWPILLDVHALALGIYMYRIARVDIFHETSLIAHVD